MNNIIRCARALALARPCERVSARIYGWGPGGGAPGSSRCLANQIPQILRPRALALFESCAPRLSCLERLVALVKYFMMLPALFSPSGRLFLFEGILEIRIIKTWDWGSSLVYIFLNL